MSFDYSQEAISDFEKLLEFDEEYNVVIHAGEKENIKEIHAHSNILRIRSQYFCTAFSDELVKKEDGKFIFNVPNISPQLFKIILRFIYCGKIDLAKLRGSDVLKLLIAVDELKIQTLILCIQEYLTKHQHEFLQQNPIEIFETATLFKSSQFINLKASLLEILLKRDDLSLDEIDIWDNLIKWCFSQHPSIQQDVKKWNKEEIAIMERTIHRFIPLIRFYHISSGDFIAKVYPFKKMIPEDLIDNVLAFHMSQDKQLNIDKPPRRCFYGSIIINKKHFAIFSSWIEKHNYSYYTEKNFPYKFNLLYRASRDGNTVVDFHNKCDNKEATVVVIKVTNSEQIVGGYNPLFWDLSGRTKSTNDSFLYSFTNKENLQSAKVGYSNGNQYSICCYSQYGPQFGGGSDLCFGQGKWTSNSDVHYHTYPKVGIPNEFKADDYEVFQVVKK
ncbi:hypothetical protein RclHR1_04930012 [Rhizophagus clarus]|uniref:BTB/POZ domain-containing protein n=1 Tax=Rhizophagus clarus TaxID=94130 RepID=A0A2Z6RX83_9GLOM|nr:hypothetical protein RclHR1_04930012 [Rhizophagus clarus]GES84935.1 BTB/POZ domain-containing protein [Rhizophagus clarus]